MKKVVVILMLILMAACQTVKIKNDTYKISNSSIELGSITNETTSITFDNEVETKAFPKLENKIRLNIAIVPFTKKTAKTYLTKIKYQQNLSKLNYTDSLAVKPEMATIQIADKLSYLNELKEDYNKSIFTLLEDLEKTQVISGIAVYFSNEDLEKIKQADVSYLVNSQDKKYTIALYKQGKKTDVLELSQNTIIGYQTNTFCWAQTQRGKWYIADMVAKSNTCKGKTFSKIRENKKEDNLFKM